MSLTVMLPVLLSAALHAIWNALVKSGKSRYLDTLLIVIGSATTAAVCLPFVPIPNRAAWPYLLGSAIIHVAYFKLVAFAYHFGDMSLVYPLTRGAAPALTTLSAISMLHESPSPGGWFGILLVSGGVLLLAADSHRAGAFQGKPVLIALVNAVVVVIYTLVDGTGARLSGHAFSYTGWMTLLTASIFVPITFAARGRRAAYHLADGWTKATTGGICTLASYSLALWAMTRAPIGLISAIRETSIVFGTLIAVALLGERVSRLRYASIAIVTAGTIIIKIFGGHTG